MKIEWTISRGDVERVKALLRKQKDNALVRKRRAENLAKIKPRVRRKQFWFQMVSMRLTSVQRSGPDSYVGKFKRKEPFPLAYEALCNVKDVENFIVNVLKNAGGIRFNKIIASQLAVNFELLEKGEWEYVLGQCSRLLCPVTCAIEKEVANYIDEKFKGFGPKQSRNLLQALGLTRYEVPIDSRVTKWLNEFGFPIRLSAGALADRDYYEFVSNGFQVLCAKSGVYPCILDAAIFALSDEEDWTDTNVY